MASCFFCSTWVRCRYLAVEAEELFFVCEFGFEFELVGEGGQLLGELGAGLGTRGAEV